MQPEVVDLSSDEEEVDLQRVNNMKAPIALDFNAHQEKYSQPNVIHIYVEQ